MTKLFNDPALHRGHARRLPRRQRALRRRASPAAWSGRSETRAGQGRRRHRRRLRALPGVLRNGRHRLRRRRRRRQHLHLAVGRGGRSVARAAARRRRRAVEHRQLRRRRDELRPGAVTQLRSEGIDAHVFAVTDDIASAPKGEETKRRGIAGDFVVFKVAGAAAEDGLRPRRRGPGRRGGQRRTRTLGVAFAAARMPGARPPAVHRARAARWASAWASTGSPGIADEPMPTAAESGAAPGRRGARPTSRQTRHHAGRGDPQRARRHQVRGAVRGLG